MKTTHFTEIHRSLGAKMVEFAGYEMPIQYNSMTAEHLAVRTAAGVFDVSHMGEVFITGENALQFVQELTVNDASKLFPGRVQYSAMCYEDGGIVDDLLVYCISSTEYLLVINASNIEKDVAWMEKNNRFGVTINNRSDDYSLLAVQGPHSKAIVEKVFGLSLTLEYYHFLKTEYKGVEFILSRTGYTGEIGYELYFVSDKAFAEKLWEELFLAGDHLGLKPVGLGARDSLRLEMGFCLYGNDIDATTNPLEAGLGWITKMKKPGFNGKKALEEKRDAGFGRKLVPIVAKERSFPRHGHEVSVEGKVIGTVTSGTVSPVLGYGIALAYVPTEYSREGTEVNFLIRGKEYPAVVSTLPFIKK